jgi:hypothetical protein
VKDESWSKSWKCSQRIKPCFESFQSMVFLIQWPLLHGAKWRNEHRDVVSLSERRHRGASLT